MTPARQQWSAALAVIVAILLAFTIDQPVARAMAGLDPAILRFAAVVTWFGQGGVVLYPAGSLVLAGLAIRFMRPDLASRLDGPIRVTAAIFVVVAAAGLADDVLKVVFGRARPYRWLAGDTSGFEFFRYGSKFASFPSGHTTTSTAAAVVFSALAPRWRLVFLLGALAIAWSRIALDVHYLSDVIAGAALGIVVARPLLERFRRLGWVPCEDNAGRAISQR